MGSSRGPMIAGRQGRCLLLTSSVRVASYSLPTSGVQLRSPPSRFLMLRGGARNLEPLGGRHAVGRRR
jgi:hypothetical protein